MRNGRRILDADAHVVEPGDVFGDAQRVGPELMDLPATTPFEAAGDTSKLADFFESGCAADAYLRCMDTEGIDAVVLYPSIGLYAPYLPELDPKGSAAACRAYNGWIAGYCATDPSRLAGVGIAPLADVTLAVDAPRRPRRVDARHRDGGAVAVAVGVLRPAVHDQHRSRRPAGGVDGVAGRRRPRRVGQRLPAPRCDVPRCRQQLPEGVRRARPRRRRARCRAVGHAGRLLPAGGPFQPGLRQPEFATPPCRPSMSRSAPPPSLSVRGGSARARRGAAGRVRPAPR